MSYCVDPIEDYTDDSDNCPSEFEGGGSHVLFFINALPTDPSSGQEVAQMITDKEAILVTNLMVGLNDPSPVESTPLRACAPATVSTYDREMTITDGKVTPENVRFWNSVNSSTGRRLMGAMIYECAEDRVTFIDKKIVLKGGRNLPNDNKGEKQQFTFVGAFTGKKDPEIFAAPDNVFPDEN